jgi:porphobilinogen synthase
METNSYLINQRRSRTSSLIRELTATIRLSYKSFIQPIFVDESIQTPREIKDLNGVMVDTIDSVINTIEEDIKNGIKKFLLFPVPANKAENRFDFAFACNVIKKIKSVFGDTIWLATDVCLCSYTTHGHCGILNTDHSKLLNSETVQILANYSCLLANAGSDCIAPSDMMDGRISAIRKKLDEQGFDAICIMSYSAKFSSQFYGPFRDACHSAPNTKGLQNRKTYQLSPSNVNDALACSIRDEKEGADILMVKPAALYTDIISKIKNISSKTIAAYHVSGEYAAIELLAEKKLVDRATAHLEVWIALQRSGAGIIISYAARHAKKWIENMDY